MILILVLFIFQTDEKEQGQVRSPPVDKEARIFAFSFPHQTRVVIVFLFEKCQINRVQGYISIIFSTVSLVESANRPAQIPKYRNW